MNTGVLRGLLTAIERARPTIRRLILANLYAVLALELAIGGAFYRFWPEPVLWTFDDYEAAQPQEYTVGGLAGQQCVTSTGPGSAQNTLTLRMGGTTSAYVTYLDTATAGNTTMTTACWYTAP